MSTKGPDPKIVYNYKIAFRKLGCIYHEVPKCGSTSIKTILFVENYDTVIVDPTHVANFEVWQTRFPASKTDGQEDTFLHFSFIRNPWARLVSSYLNTGGDTFFERHGASFNDFIATLPQRLNSGLDDVFNNHFRPQTSFLPIDPSGQIALDFIGRFESLAEDWERLGQALGRTLPPLPRLNPSRRADYRSFYTDDTAALVADIYQCDIVASGYTF